MVVAARLRIFGGLGASVVDARAASATERLLVVQAKPLAVLAYVALAHRDGAVQRDTLLGIFWPDAEQRSARGSLRQALYHLRRTVGPDALLSHGVDAIVPGPGLWCDAVELERLVALGDLEAALDLYRGDAFAGVHLSDPSVRYEGWVDARRAHYQRIVARAARTLAERAAAAGQVAEVARWVERAGAIDPDDERVLRRGLGLLVDAGDPRAALRIADRAMRQAERDDDRLEAETIALVASIRARVAAQAETTTASPRPVESLSAVVAYGTPDLRTPEAETPAEGRPEEETPAKETPAKETPAPMAAELPVLPAGVSDLPRRRPGRRRAWRRVAIASLALMGVVGLTRGTVVGLATSRSPLASGLYDEGLRATGQRQYPGAARLFHLALSADSQCAVCAYQASAVEFAYDGASSFSDLMHAVRLAPAAPPEQRLTIATAAAYMTNSPGQLALAERLAARDSASPAADAALGHARLVSGDFLGAVGPLERAIRTVRRRRSVVDTAFVADARRTLMLAYQSADSLAAAERECRAWIRETPGSASAWLELANVLGREYRFEAAMRASHESSRLNPVPGSDAITRAVLALRAGDFEVADGTLAPLLQDGDDRVREEAVWWSILSLRTQGRLTEALALARQYRRSGPTPGFGEPTGTAAGPEAQVLFEMGRYREASALFEAIAASAAESAAAAPGTAARHQVWYLTHSATALAAAGDRSLAMVAETIAAIAPRSGYGRDHHLPPYVQGLMALSDGRRDDAERLFRQAIGSPTEGYTRAQLELGRLLVDDGQPREAIAVLEPALRGPIESGSYYATLTEFHALLARAFDATGSSDSALVHHAWVARAWAHGDPQFVMRASAARQRASRLAEITVASAPDSE